MDRSTDPTAPAFPPSMHVPTRADLGLLELANDSPLRIALTPAGRLFSIRHGGTLVNQLLPAPADTGLFRLFVRERPGEAPTSCRDVLATAGSFECVDGAGARWVAEAGDGLKLTVRLDLHPSLAAWRWHVLVRNTGTTARGCDVILGQDLGLADEGAARNNEAYTSQYIDLLPVCDERLGWTVLARQNQEAAGGKHPWLALACREGAVAFATDGWQLFGTDHRHTGMPTIARDGSLASERFQYECAMAVLQSPVIGIAPGSEASVSFVACFEEDHAGASDPLDLDRLRDVLSGAIFASPADAARAGPPTRPPPASIFLAEAPLHGEAPNEHDWEAWFPGPRRHEELGTNGDVWSFFHATDTHVISGGKEARVARPHGHILRSGEGTWIDDTQFGVTCYAAGVFGSQVYLGNPSFARLVPVMRNALGVTRSTGQRVFVRRAGVWRALGIPSAWAVTPGEVRWIYRWDGDVLEARVWCSPQRPASFLELTVLAGKAQEFLVSHEMVLGAAEYEHGGQVDFHPDLGWAGAHPAPASLVGQQEPGVCFAIAAAEAKSIAAIGGDELAYPDGRRRSGAYAMFLSRPVNRLALIMLGTRDGAAALPAAIAVARAEYITDPRAAHPPALVLRLRREGDPALSRVDDIVPWFNHNATIHFSAPHGLEQYGGAAWGVRDVTQGSIEWLLAHGRHGVMRRVLETVFAQQYAHDGTWPQWFMHAPYRFIQHVHSHGDVCFWPVKALCDYVEAADDVAFMDRTVGYTAPASFDASGPVESLWDHCERVLDHVAGRFLAGTALVNYGDGDWDDTLQPADPAMRTHMVSAWTVALSFQAFHQLAEVARRGGRRELAARLDSLLTRIGLDFRAHLMPGGIVAGFLVAEERGTRPLLHPDDAVTGIRYRLLPMTRAIIAGLFTTDEARRHLEIIARELRYPDGVRLMSDPVRYRGGREQWFKRADTAANVGREIGLQYVHAHIRYAEALARVGDADGLWHALQVVNPVALSASVPNASPRQSNVYFSSSDADFSDRYEAAARWGELKDGRVAVRGGWRLYSSGPGLFLHKLRSCLLGIRESFDDVVFDPVLPRALDGLVATVVLCGSRTEMAFRVRRQGFGPDFIHVNGTRFNGRREDNPYRKGGLRIPASQLAAALATSDNRVEIEL